MTRIKYKILKVWPEVRGVDVHYYTDDFPEGRKLHVQFMTEKMPSSIVEIDEYILAYAPREDLEHKGRLKTEPTPNMDALHALVGKEREEGETSRNPVNMIVL